MKRHQRISRRVIRNFLQLSAAAFTFGANLPNASAANSFSQPATPRNAPALRRNAAMAPEVETAPYQHTFAIGTDDAEYPAQVNVIASNGVPALRSILHVPGRVGPLPDGAYTVAIKTRSGDETQLVRIGPDTDPYLNFLTRRDKA